jgi:hypothetical protein
MHNIIGAGYMTASNVNVKIAERTTLLMRVEDVEIINVETNLPADLTSPDTIVFRVKDSAGTIVEVSGNQEGSTNNFNAQYLFTTAGTYTWSCEIIEGAVKYNTVPEVIKVVAAIDDA